jgi:hypothetical protein
MRRLRLKKGTHMIELFIEIFRSFLSYSKSLNRCILRSVLFFLTQEKCYIKVANILLFSFYSKSNFTAVVLFLLWKNQKSFIWLYKLKITNQSIWRKQIHCHKLENICLRLKLLASKLETTPTFLSINTVFSFSKHSNIILFFQHTFFTKSCCRG